MISLRIKAETFTIPVEIIIVAIKTSYEVMDLLVYENRRKEKVERSGELLTHNFSLLVGFLFSLIQTASSHVVYSVFLWKNFFVVSIFKGSS